MHFFDHIGDHMLAHDILWIGGIPSPFCEYGRNDNDGWCRVTAIIANVNVSMELLLHFSNPDDHLEELP